MRIFYTLLLTAFASISYAQCVINSDIIAITNITLVPMTDTTTVWNDQTVIIQNQKITQIGNSTTITVPQAAYIIDGTGKYLIPGLCDMHAHLLQRNDAILELANGVTTVCNMHGEPWHISFRDSINAGKIQLFSNKIASPRIYSTGPIMNYTGHPFFNATPIVNQTDALTSLQSQDAKGYDFYKTYTYLTSSVFNTIQNYANTSGKFIRGHGNDWIGALNIINSKQKSIEHFWGYLPNGGLDATEQTLEDSTISKGKWNCPTLIVRWNREHLDSIRANEPSYIKYVYPPSLLNSWRNTTANPQQFSNISEFMKLLKRLYKKNGKLMLGTDNITPYSVAGFDLHKELELYVQAGLSPHQALTLATAKPYQFLQECGFGNNAGTIEIGKRADLVILNLNPLVNISNTKSIFGVIGNGSYYASTCLQNLLSNVSTTNTAIINEFNANKQTLEVYPNPATSKLNIKGLPDNSQSEIMVINQLGRIILKSKFVSQLSIEAIPAGFYYILVFDGHTYYSQKFVKQ